MFFDRFMPPNKEKAVLVFAKIKNTFQEAAKNSSTKAKTVYQEAADSLEKSFNALTAKVPHIDYDAVISEALANTKKYTKEIYRLAKTDKDVLGEFNKVRGKIFTALGGLFNNPNQAVKKPKGPKL